MSQALRPFFVRPFFLVLHQQRDMPDFLFTDKIKDLNCLTETDCPPGFSFRRQDNSVLYYNLVFDNITGVPSVEECLSINEQLHVTLTYRGYHLPLPRSEWEITVHCTENQCL